jgi:hypothetical protein
MQINEDYGRSFRRHALMISLGLLGVGLAALFDLVSVTPGGYPGVFYFGAICTLISGITCTWAIASGSGRTMLCAYGTLLAVNGALLADVAVRGIAYLSLARP